MSERTLKRMVWVLGVLVLAWLVVRVVGAGRSFGPGEGGGAMTTFLEGMDPGSITAVEFTGGDEGTVRLERAGTAAGSSWTVEGHPADSTQAASLMDALAGATTGAPVSRNPENHGQMEVDDSSARLMVLEGEGEADTLLLGKAGPSYSTVYARSPGQDEVYLLDANLRPHAGRSAADWRSKKIAAVDTAMAQAVVVTRDASSYRVERGDSAWTVDGGPADSQTVHDLLAELVSVQAQSFPAADSASAPEGDPDRTVTVLGTDGSRLLVVRLWEPGEGEGSDLTGTAEGPAARQPDTRFTFASWRADRLVPEAEGIREEEGGG
ncbi:MAG TPA: DUF4340 domain-containing protein [Longimicrobiales bacterium]|nr:DUF4340 domain-containing protein [Longimicrobiales bacterium]